jgi:hypothetical protein
LCGKKLSKPLVTLVTALITDKISLNFQASRKFAKIFSITVWVACALSIIKYLLALILIATHRENIIESCEATGFVSMTHPETSITTTFNSSPYYHPVSYPGTLNAGSMSYDECSEAIKVMLITFGVVVFVIQIVQVSCEDPFYIFRI